MEITIKNCNNIDEGAIEIEPGCLNIKYANNGTGKSTIAKAIRAFATQDVDEQKLLTPYHLIGKRSGPKPNVSFSKNMNDIDIHNVEIFDDRYVNQFLFKKDILINDAFSIFVKTPEYDENMKKISTQLQQITQDIQNNETLNNIISLLEDFSKKCGTGKEKIAKGSKIEKSLSTGNSLAEIAPQFRAYESFLQDRSDYRNAKWVGWISEGQDYLADNHSCPFCLSKDQKNNISTTADISKHFDKKSLEELTSVLNTFDEIAEYLNDEYKELLNKLATEAKGLDDSAFEQLSNIRKNVFQIHQKFTELRSINASSINNIDSLLSDISNKKISLDGTPFGSKMNQIVEEVNTSFDKVYNQAKAIKNDIEKQTKIIESTINTNKESINGFLRTAGYNYKVDIKHENGTANIYLLPSELSNPIDNAKDHLSYGERNAFAMVLFMFSAVKKNPDLIILDDPISSFDGNKKFALLNMMFLSSNPDSIGQEDQTKYALLKDKTVLLMTHDFTTVLDIVHTLHMCFQNTKAHVLTNKNNILTEKKITKEDFKSFRKIAESMIQNPQSSIVTKVVYLRRLLDFFGEKDDAYDMLSSLLHLREKPSFRTGPMGNEDIERALKTIRSDEYIPDFDYGKVLKIIQDDKQLKDIYKSSNDYEKIHIFCIYMRKHPEEVHDVLQKYTNEFFHIENDSIYQLDPTKFSLIPQYIIEACDKIMGQA